MSNDVPRNGGAHLQVRDARTTVERSPCSLADQADASQAAEPATLELVDGLLVVALANGSRRILARVAELEPLIGTGGGS